MVTCPLSLMGFPGGSDGKEAAAMQETWVQSLCQEDLLEKGMAIHSSILAWRIPWIEEPGWLQSMAWQRVGHNGVTKTNTQRNMITTQVSAPLKDK